MERDSNQRTVARSTSHEKTMSSDVFFFARCSRPVGRSGQHPPPKRHSSLVTSSAGAADVAMFALHLTSWGVISRKLV